MAHELTQTNGATEMAYVGETPWHGLGQKLEEGASIEEWKKAAGMDWTINRKPLTYFADRACTDLRTVEDTRILTRSDNGNKIGLVSPSYQVVQPGEVLEFFRDLVAEEGYSLHTAGTMFGGSKYWALAKIEEATIAGWDKVGGYVLLSTSADGSRATELRETTIRVVCNNTLSMAVNKDSRSVIKVNHRQDFDIAAIHKQMGVSRERFAAFTEVADRLSQIKVGGLAAEAFMAQLFKSASVKAAPQGDDEDADTLLTTKTRKHRGLDIVMGLFNGIGMGSTQKGSKGTAWGAVNAVTEYVDHLSTSKTQDHRLDRAWFGTGNSLKTDALILAQDFFAA